MRAGQALRATLAGCFEPAGWVASNSSEGAVSVAAEQSNMHGPAKHASGQHGPQMGALRCHAARDVTDVLEDKQQVLVGCCVLAPCPGQGSCIRTVWHGCSAEALCSTALGVNLSCTQQGMQGQVPQASPRLEIGAGVGQAG